MMGELQNKALEKRELQQQMQELQKLEAAADKKEAAVAAARKELDKLLVKPDQHAMLLTVFNWMARSLQCQSSDLMHTLYLQPVRQTLLKLLSVCEGCIHGLRIACTRQFAQLLNLCTAAMLLAVGEERQAGRAELYSSRAVKAARRGSCRSWQTSVRSRSR